MTYTYYYFLPNVFSMFLRGYRETLQTNNGGRTEKNFNHFLIASVVLYKFVLAGSVLVKINFINIVV